MSTGRRQYGAVSQPKIALQRANATDSILAVVPEVHKHGLALYGARVKKIYIKQKKKKKKRHKPPPPKKKTEARLAATQIVES